MLLRPLLLVRLGVLLGVGAMTAVLSATRRVPVAQTVSAPPLPTADLPRLLEGQVLDLVAERLSRSHRLNVPRSGKATYQRDGRWTVSYLGGEWEVFEAGYRGFPLNGLARIREVSARETVSDEPTPTAAGPPAPVVTLPPARLC